MLVINRFAVSGAERADFEDRMSAAVELLGGKPGCESVDLVQNLDEPGLWALVSRWRDVGSYRRALGGYESKMIIVPLLSLAIDEASAFDDPARIGENLPRTT